MDKLQKLKAIAEKATPGPWQHVYKAVWEADIAHYCKISPGYWWSIGHLPHSDNASGKIKPDKDAKHIATFSPDTVLKLINVIENLKNQRDNAILSAMNFNHKLVARKIVESDEKLEELLEKIEVPNE